MKRIGLIAAMPEEIGPLLRMIGPAQKDSTCSRRFYRIQTRSQSIGILESGMGSVNAESATRLLIDTFRPELIISFGFAGSLSTRLNVGDIAVADRLLNLHHGLFSEQQGLTGDLVESILPDALRAAFISTATVTSKKELAGILPANITLAVVEMETAAVAHVAKEAEIPMIAVRSISDRFDDELGFSLEEFCDSSLNLKIWRVALTIAKKPWILPQLIRLSGNSQIAAKALAVALSDIITRLPDQRLPPAADRGKSLICSASSSFL